MITSTIGKCLYQTSLVYEAKENDIKIETHDQLENPYVTLIKEDEPKIIKEESIETLWDEFDEDNTDLDFDDFDDLKESGVTSIMVKILVFLIVLILIAGAVVLANFMFDLGLF